MLATDVASTDSPPSRLKLFAPAVFDLLAPVAVYFALHAVGVGDFVALAAGGFVTGANTVVGTVRRRRLDGVGVLVVIEIAVSIGLLFVTGDPRVLLLKPVVYVGVGAIYMLASSFRGRPLTLEFSRLMAARGGAARLAAYDRAWDRSAQFRRAQRTIGVVWGIAFAAEAVLRTVVVLSFSVKQVPQALVWSQVPGVIVILLAMLVTRTQVPALGRAVDEQMEAGA
jgi:hypothetical protein